MKNPLWLWITGLWRLWLSGWKAWLAVWRWWMSLFHAPGAAAPGEEPQPDPTRVAPARGAFERRAIDAPPSTAPPSPDPQAPQATKNARKRNAATKARFAAGNYGNAAGRRDYKLFVPAGERTVPAPLLVMLHGCKQDPDDFARGTQMNALAEAQGMLVLYPAQPESANRYRCWNWFHRADQQRGAGEPAILAGMIEKVLQQQGGDPAQVFVAGLSAGAAMAVVLAHTYPELIRGVGVHSGVPYGAAHGTLSALSLMKRGVPHAGNWPFVTPGHDTAAHGVPMIVFHGDQDKTVHPRNSELLVEQALRETGAGAPEVAAPPLVEHGELPDSHRYTRSRFGSVPGATPLEHWLVHGMGHAWSGGDARGSFTDPLGPNASQAMLQFFMSLPPVPAHGLPPAAALASTVAD